MSYLFRILFPINAKPTAKRTLKSIEPTEIGIEPNKGNTNRLIVKSFPSPIPMSPNIIRPPITPQKPPPMK